ncbi:MAG TPA: alkaline phosphatase D family protein [Kofleriaceae bacterium]|nr:alkaline phosphatase D family protein [Kofleriaceae bacterium]
MTLSRRDFIRLATTLGASLAWSGTGCKSRTSWRERRDLYPEGVASGDPDPQSVILWTRRPFDRGDKHVLTVEVAEDESFARVIAHAPAPVSAASDWTTRVLVAGLKPAQVYWYRFTDADGHGSRVGRTITAPTPDDPRAVNFAFVSCQTINEGSLDAYRRMIYEDERAAPAEQLGFVLHLGDFIYEVVQYPDEAKTRYDRTIYEVARLPDGHKIGNFHIPLTLDGYRAIYKAYLHDPDLQDARARWPFVCIWDNHEFSWMGYQSLVKAGPFEQPGQTIKVAANQAWFEYLPARVAPPSKSLDQFGPPAVQNVKVDTFDDHGLGTEPNNLVAIHSLEVYRTLRYGKHLDLIITDLYSYRSPDPYADDSLGKLGDWDDYNGMFPESIMQVLDAGRAFNAGNPPAELQFKDARVANPQKTAPPQTLLGAEQKAWFKDQLTRATATWKIWASSQGTLETRADPENLPPGVTKAPWPPGMFANLGARDHGAAWTERREIFEVVRDAKLTGFAIVAGDRHSFWAGYASAELPPGTFDPVGVSFIGASLSSPGAMEAHEHKIKKDLPLRPIYLADRPNGAKPDWTYNLLLKHGVRSCFEYAKTFDLARARAVSNPALAPHVAFVDMGAHGYAKVRLSGDEMRTEFVCIPRPIARNDRPDGGPLRYRVVHTAKLWRAGEKPTLTRHVLEGDPGLGI